MHTKEISFDAAIERYSGAMEQIRNKISTAPAGYKVKGIPVRDLQYPGSFKFHFEYSVTCGGSIMGEDFMNMVKSGELQRKAEEEKNYQNTATLEQKVSRHLAQVGSVVLTAYAVGSTRSFGVRLADGYYPRELYDQILEYEVSADNERRRLSMLTPSERQAEQNEILRQLSGSAGFAHMIIPATTRITEPLTEPTKKRDRFSDIV